MHDFPDKKLGKAAPYGIYDVGDGQGYVNVGIDHDTGEFSAASIRRWWGLVILLYTLSQRNRWLELEGR